MSGNIGLNGNQNFSAKNHNSTKVLQPPGGVSSFSIGGFGGGTEAPRPRKLAPRAAAPEPSYNRPPIQQSNRQQGPPMGYNNSGRPRSNSEDVGSDALDSAMDKRRGGGGGGGGIPGLEGHYNAREQIPREQAPRNDYGSESYSGRGVQGKMSKSEYADSLKAQITNKRSIKGGDSYSDSNNGNYQGQARRNNNYENTNEPQYGSGNASFSNSNQSQPSARGAPAKMSSNEYADALRAQINTKRGNGNNQDNGVTSSIGSRAPQRKEQNYGNNGNNGYNYNDEAKENHFQERAQGSVRISNAPGGNSNFQLY